MLRRLKRREMAFRVMADQNVGSVVFSGGNKAIMAYEKFLQELED